MSMLIVLAIICVAGVAGLFAIIGSQGAKPSKPTPGHSPSRRKSGSETDVAQAFTYSRQKSLFTQAELAFYRALREAIADRYQVFGKVRVADVLKPQTENRGDWQRAFNKISAKHFDFLLCDRDSLKVLAAVELDDSSHRRIDRVKRDDFLNQAVENAGLPLLRFPVQAIYDIKAIEHHITQTLGQPELKKDKPKPKPKPRPIKP